MAGKIFGLFIWIHDDPIQGNVLNLSNITSPRKSFNEYAVGDLVMAKCPGFGIAEGILGKIADEKDKKELEAILKGPGFKQLIDTTKQTNGTPKRKKINDESVEETPPQKTPTQKTPKQKTPPKKTATQKTPPKRKRKVTECSEDNIKTKAELQKIAEELACTELSSNMDIEEKKESSFQTVKVLRPIAVREKPASEVIGDSLRLISGHEQPDSQTTWISDTSSQGSSSDSNCQCSIRVKALEEQIKIFHSTFGELFHRLGQAESSLTWSWNLLNNMAYNPKSNSVERQTETTEKCTENTTVKTTEIPDQCKSQEINIKTETCSKSEVKAGPSFEVENDFDLEEHVSEPEESQVCLAKTKKNMLYNGLLKSQLEQKIAEVDNYKKASTRLFRLMYTKEECDGRSLTGSISKTGTKRPALEDLDKLDILRSIIRSKWRFVTPNMVNAVLRDLLKPCRQK
ncbi:hypothetical protein AM593_07419, partial [Mytilus galloprovincialis]